MKYTPQELIALANDQGPFATSKMRQALKWAADVLIAADEAVEGERQRADAATKKERERQIVLLKARIEATVMSKYATTAECEAARQALRNALLYVWGEE